MAPTLYRTIALGCGLSLLQGGSAWLPVSPNAATTARGCASRPLQAAAGDTAGGGGRPDLVSMKRSFETSMDNKLIMEYVTVSLFKFANTQQLNSSSSARVVTHVVSISERVWSAMQRSSSSNNNTKENHGDLFCTAVHAIAVHPAAQRQPSMCIASGAGLCVCGCTAVCVCCICPERASQTLPHLVGRAKPKRHCAGPRVSV